MGFTDYSMHDCLHGTFTFHSNLLSIGKIQPQLDQMKVLQVDQAYCTEMLVSLQPTLLRCKFPITQR